MVTTAAEHTAWTQQGSVDASKRTFASVKAALAASDELNGVGYEAFLQGSYANDTNTRGDSDVDVVVMMTSTFMPETARLSAAEQTWHAQNRIPGTTFAAELRQKVERALRAYYGSARVQSKNKCLRVAKGTNTVDADVVLALQHRLFTSPVKSFTRPTAGRSSSRKALAAPLPSATSKTLPDCDEDPRGAYV